MMRVHLVRSSAAIVVGSLWFTPVQAQVADIVVTAQKRPENVQHVPISITAITAKALDSSGVTNNIGLNLVTPGLTISRSNNASVTYIRGVGAQSAQVGQESPVATFVDGVYVASLPAAVYTFNNIERIEVLKGPQGTLFGRNATGGVIQVITEDPTEDLQVKGRVGIDNYETLDDALYVAGGVAPNVRADIALVGSDQIEGYGKNLALGNADTLKTKEYGIRSKVLIDLSARTQARIIGNYSYVDSSFGIATRQIAPSVLLDGIAKFPGNWWDINSNFAPLFRSKQYGGSFRLTHDFDFARFLSLTSYSQLRSTSMIDQDGSSANVVDATITEKSNSLTQELQLQSLTSSKIKWTLGGFYLHGNANSVPLQLNGSPYAKVGGEDVFIKTRLNSYAAFGDTTIPVLTGTNITLGLRYTIDERGLNGYQVYGDGAGYVSRVDHGTDKKLTWRASIDHQFTHDILVYVSDARGFKSGIYSTTNLLNPRVLPETLDAYEAGIKADLFDKKVRANASVFHYNYKNIQLSEIVPGGTPLLNAAAGRINGADVDITLAPIDRLTLRSGLSLLDAKYTNFPNAPFATPAAEGNTVFVGDASGKKMIRTPDWTLSAIADYSVPLGSGELGFNLTYFHSAAVYFTPDNRVSGPAYNLLNAQISWAIAHDRYRFRVWGRNFGNSRYYIQGFESSLGDTAVVGPPRTIGVGFDFKL